MRVVTLIENHTDSNLACEHGLSFYVEYNEKSYLLDAGQSGLFMDNAEKLGIDLAGVNTAVLSHAHYDHAGGFAAFAKENTCANVYMQKTSVEKCLCKKPDGMKNIGIPDEVTENLNGRIVYVDGDLKLDEGVYLIAHRTAGLEKRGEQMHMYREFQGHKKYDDFAHEQSLVFDMQSGLVVFNSCSHSGVDLVLEEVKQVFGDRTILAMFGGFHLMGADGPDSMRESEAQVRSLAEKLSGMNVAALYTGHCTGTKAFPILKEVLGERLNLLVTGMSVEIF